MKIIYEIYLVLFVVYLAVFFIGLIVIEDTWCMTKQKEDFIKIMGVIGVILIASSVITMTLLPQKII